MIKLDRKDIDLLKAIQQDVTPSLKELGEQLNISSTPLWKRIRRLEEAGVVQKRVALLDAEQLGLHLTAIVQLKTTNHSTEWLGQFFHVVNKFDEITEAYRLAGEYDYLLKIQVPDIAAFDRFYKALVNSVPNLSDVTSTFAMERIKATASLPLDHIKV